MLQDLTLNELFELFVGFSLESQPFVTVESASVGEIED